MNRYDILIGKELSPKKKEKFIISEGWRSIDLGEGDSETGYIVTIVERATADFLHEHPRLQQQLSVDENHVIVDRKDWERARAIFSGQNQMSSDDNSLSNSIRNRLLLF